MEDEELDVNKDEIRLKLEVLDYDGKKKAEYMCSAQVTLGELKSGGNSGDRNSRCDISSLIFRTYRAV